MRPEQQKHKRKYYIVFFFPQETLSKYKVKAKDGDEEYEQEIKIDTEKQTETYHIPKTKSSSAGEVDEVYDFKRVSKLAQQSK